MSPLTGTKNIHSFCGVNVVNSWHRKKIIKTACALKKLLEHTLMFFIFVQKFSANKILLTTSEGEQN